MVCDSAACILGSQRFVEGIAEPISSWIDFNRRRDAYVLPRRKVLFLPCAVESQHDRLRFIPPISSSEEERSISSHLVDFR